MKEYKNGDVKCIDFSNLYEQYDYVKDKIDDESSNLAKMLKGEGYDKSFYGEHNLYETMNAMQYGLKDYTAYFLDNLDEVTSEEDVNCGIFMDTEGFAYDMGAVVAGEPECCVNMTGLSPVPIINIVVDVGNRYDVTAKELKNKGIAIVNLINTLITKKYIVNLEFLEYNEQGYCHIKTQTKCKVDTTTSNIATIAMLCAPEYFRQVAFLSVEKMRNNGSNGGEGCSKPTQKIINEIEKDALLIRGSYIDNDATYNGCYNTLEKANKHITKLFNEYLSKGKL